MLAAITKVLRSRALDAEGYLEALNREWLPVLQDIRAAINGAVGSEDRLPLVRVTYDPTAGTGTAYAIVDALSPTVMTGAVFDEGNFPATSNGRARSCYFAVVGGMVGASTSVSFALYDVTAAANVSGSEVTTSSANLVRLTSSAVTLVDGHAYNVVSKRADGTADALVAEAEILIRYA